MSPSENLASPAVPAPMAAERRVRRPIHFTHSANGDAVDDFVDAKTHAVAGGPEGYLGAGNALAR